MGIKCYICGYVFKEVINIEFVIFVLENVFCSRGDRMG